jgi:hypothetical protein
MYGISKSVIGNSNACFAAKSALYSISMSTNMTWYPTKQYVVPLKFQGYIFFQNIKYKDDQRYSF